MFDWSEHIFSSLFEKLVGRFQKRKTNGTERYEKNLDKVISVIDVDDLPPQPLDPYLNEGEGDESDAFSAGFDK